MERERLIKEIINALAILSQKVRILNSQNLTDLNVVAENFFRDLLNMALGYKLKNINIVDQNAAAIDLGCSETKLAIQVTSTSNLLKTKSTVTKFVERELYKTYDRLVIFNLVEVTRHRDNFIGTEGIFLLNTKTDLWDCSSFVRMLADKAPDELEKIANFIFTELGLERPEIIPKEVRTIVALIDFLSNHEHPDEGNGYIDQPDPNGKIYERFADHSAFLTSTYSELYAVYGPNYDIVEANLDISSVQITKISIYLKHHSDKVLSECGNNPEKALEQLVSSFSESIKSQGTDFDEMAIRFYLVNQLIRCNVFPNVRR